MGSLNLIGGPTAVSAPGSMAIAMPDGVTPSVSVNGGAYTALAGTGFSSDVIVQLPNATPTLINALELVATLPTNTPGAEIGQWTIKVVANGALATVGAFGWQNAGVSATLYVGDPALGNGFKSIASQVSFLRNSATVMFCDANGLNLSTRFMEGRATLASAQPQALNASGNDFNITGTTGIQGIVTTGLQAGSRITLELVSGITITHNSGAPGASAVAIQLRAAANLTTAKVYFLDLVYNGTFWTQPD